MLSMMLKFEVIVEQNQKYKDQYRNRRHLGNNKHPELSDVLFLVLRLHGICFDDFILTNFDGECLHD